MRVTLYKEPGNLAGDLAGFAWFDPNHLRIPAGLIGVENFFRWRPACWIAEIRVKGNVDSFGWKAGFARKETLHEQAVC